MKAIRKIFFLIIVFCACSSFSQPAAVWTARFNGLLDSTDVAKDITVDSQGNTYVTGYSYNLLGLLTDIITISYDSAGNLRWSKSFGGLLNDAGNALILDNTQQFVYVTGYTNGLLDLTASDYVIIKYDAATGNEIWSRTYNYGLLGDDKAAAIAIDSQNNPVITGYSQGFLILLTPYDYATVKYDQNGNQQWVSRYNGTGSGTDRAYAIVVDGSDNVIVTGESQGSGSNYDYGTVKYNSSGQQQWAQRYNGPANSEDRAYAIVVDGSDNVIVTGESRGNGTSSDYSTVKYSPSGSQQWAQRYNGPANSEDRAYAIVVDGGDSVIVTGESDGSGTSSDYSTVKYSPSGNQQWASRYNGNGNSEDRAYAIVVDGADNIFVTGTSRTSNSPGSEDYSTLKYSPAGTQQWAASYNGTGNSEDRAYAIVVDGSDNIYITGTSRNNNLLGSEDFLTIKYKDLPKPISIVSAEIPVTNSLQQNYPNPFNPKTSFSFDIAKTGHVNITIYDALGNSVAVVVDRVLNAGKYSAQFDASGLASGIYFYRIKTGTFSDTKKLILAK
jgi:hypothetical protein